jgi:protein phosphatase
MIDATFGAATDVGRVRELNEDSVLAVPDVFVVADGMGGHAAGEVASALAVERIGALAGREDLRPEDITTAIGQANDAILGCSAEHQENSGMGTTITGVCLGEVGGTPHWFVFNVGDSRTYRFADDTLQQVTVDHSEVEELLAAGRITAEEARHHPLRNVVTRSLGTDPGPVPDLWVLPAIEGDRFLICSDGLPLEVPEDHIADLLRRNLTPQESADALVGMAVAAGGHDNVSAVVVEIPTSDAPSAADISTSPRARATGGNR